MISGRAVSSVDAGRLAVTAFRYLRARNAAERSVPCCPILRFLSVGTYRETVARAGGWTVDCCPLMDGVRGGHVVVVDPPPLAPHRFASIDFASTSRARRGRSRARTQVRRSFKIADGHNTRKGKVYNIGQHNLC